MPGDRVDRFETNCMQKKPNLDDKRLDPSTDSKEYPNWIQFESEFRDKNKRKNY